MFSTWSILSVFFSSKCSLFHNANLFGSCIIHILYTGYAKIKKNNSGAKGLNNICNSSLHPITSNISPPDLKRSAISIRFNLCMCVLGCAHLGVRTWVCSLGCAHLGVLTWVCVLGCAHVGEERIQVQKKLSISTEICNKTCYVYFFFLIRNEMLVLGYFFFLFAAFFLPPLCPPRFNKAQLCIMTRKPNIQTAIFLWSDILKVAIHIFSPCISHLQGSNTWSVCPSGMHVTVSKAL